MANTVTKFLKDNRRCTSTPKRRRGCLRHYILEPRCDLDLWPPECNPVISWD